jgi:hypothetical protein
MNIEDVHVSRIREYMFYREYIICPANASPSF